MFDFNTLPKKIQNNLYCKYRQKNLMLHTVYLCKKVVDKEILSIEEVVKIHSEYRDYIRKHNIFELIELERMSLNRNQHKTIQ